MKPYIEKLMAAFSDGEAPSDRESVTRALYGCYHEIHPQDSEGIRERFSQLDVVLQTLTLRDYDKVWDLTCQLCGDHEKDAFLEGIRVGVCLAAGEWKNCS